MSHVHQHGDHMCVSAWQSHVHHVCISMVITCASHVHQHGDHMCICMAITCASAWRSHVHHMCISMAITCGSHVHQHGDHSRRLSPSVESANFQEGTLQSNLMIPLLEEFLWAKQPCK